jgi:hypothetical protein
LSCRRSRPSPSQPSSDTKCSTCSGTLVPAPSSSPHALNSHNRRQPEEEDEQWISARNAAKLLALVSWPSSHSKWNRQCLHGEHMGILKAREHPSTMAAALGPRDRSATSRSHSLDPNMVASSRTTCAMHTTHPTTPRSRRHSDGEAILRTCRPSPDLAAAYTQATNTSCFTAMARQHTPSRAHTREPLDLRLRTHTRARNTPWRGYL